MGAKNRFARDRFDAVAVGGQRGARVGAHRSHPRQRQWTRWLLAVVSLTLFFTALGVLWLIRVGTDSTVFSSAKEAVQAPTVAAQQQEDRPSEAEQTSSEPEAEAPAPQLVPSAETTVAVLNGTSVQGLAGVVGAEITGASWGNVTLIGNAPVRDLATTTVIFTQESEEPAAQALAQALGGAAVRLDPLYAEYGAVLVVEVGADRAG